MYSSIHVSKFFFQAYRLFVDLDGVLVDFERGVLELCGKSVDSFEPRRSLWQALTRIPDFYTRLPWMTDGKSLWEALGNLCPAILTGVPMGTWAEPQKRAWCAQNLGKDVTVFVGPSAKKATIAAGLCKGELQPILIDDRISLQKDWESIGGVFIHHKNAKDSLEQLQELLKGVLSPQASQ